MRGCAGGVPEHEVLLASCWVIQSPLLAVCFRVGWLLLCKLVAVLGHGTMPMVDLTGDEALVWAAALAWLCMLHIHGVHVPV